MTEFSVFLYYTMSNTFPQYYTSSPNPRHYRDNVVEGTWTGSYFLERSTAPFVCFFLFRFN